MTDAELVAAVEAGMSSTEIAERHGLTRQQINRRRAALGLSGDAGRPTQRPARLDDAEWLRSGTLDELAADAGVSVSTVSRARRAVNDMLATRAGCR